jgi:hypothetical protein
VLWLLFCAGEIAEREGPFEAQGKQAARLQFAGATEGTEGIEEEQERKSDGNEDEPVGGVTPIRPQDGADADQAEKGKDGADGFKEHLMESAPETTESALAGSCGGRARHERIVAQKR